MTPGAGASTTGQPASGTPAWGRTSAAGTSGAAAAAAGAAAASSTTTSTTGAPAARRSAVAGAATGTGEAERSTATSWTPAGTDTTPAPTPGDTTPATAPGGDTPADPPQDGEEVPDWRSLLKAMAPPPGPAQEPAETGSIPVVGENESTDEVAAVDTEVPERIRRPLPFTWLQWIILIVVFFVLGFLIVLVAKTADIGATGDVAPALALAADLLPSPLT